MDTTKFALKSAIYHGLNKEPPFFQSWYFKLVTADQQHSYAIIPGVMLGVEPHTSVQVLNGSTGHSVFFEYPIQAFRPEVNKFGFSINKKNQFSPERVAFDIAMEHGGIKGELIFRDLLPGTVTNSADFYRSIPSLSHQLAGILTIDSQPIDFTGGYGTIQTLWGNFYPDASIWIQANRLDPSAASLALSLELVRTPSALVPGFAASFRLGDMLYFLAPETGAKVTRLEIGDERVLMALADTQYVLEIAASRVKGCQLRVPTNVDTSRKVEHTLNATVQMRLSTRSGEKIFIGADRCASVELSEPGRFIKK
jgi:hypothetical protein